MFPLPFLSEISSSTGCSPSTSTNRQKAWKGSVLVTALADVVDCSWQFVTPDDTPRYITLTIHDGLKMGSSRSRDWGFYTCGDSYCDNALGSYFRIDDTWENWELAELQGISSDASGVVKWTCPSKAKAFMIKVVASTNDNGYDDGRESKGFEISFEIHAGGGALAPVPGCTGCTECGTYTGTSWAISDGPGDYSINANCEWIFKASSPLAGVEITFSSFDLYYDVLFNILNRDSVVVYECTMNDCSHKTEIRSLSGKDFLPPRLLAVPFKLYGSTPFMMVRFTSVPRVGIFSSGVSSSTGFDATFTQITKSPSEPPAPTISTFTSGVGSLISDLLSRGASSAVSGEITPLTSAIVALTAAPLYIVGTNGDTLEIPDPVLKDPEWQSEVFIQVSAGGSGSSSGLAFSDYEVAVTLPRPYTAPYEAPAWSWCTPGVDCPPGGDTCSYGYPINGWACASGCAQQAGGGDSQCSQSTCCSCTARPPSNGQIKKPGESFVSQVLDITTCLRQSSS